MIQLHWGARRQILHDAEGEDTLPIRIIAIFVIFFVSFVAVPPLYLRVSAAFQSHQSGEGQRNPSFAMVLLKINCVDWMTRFSLQASPLAAFCKRIPDARGATHFPLFLFMFFEKSPKLFPRA